MTVITTPYSLLLQVKDDCQQSSLCLPETAAQPFDPEWLWSGLGLGLQLSLHLEWAPEIEGPVLDRVEGDHGKPGFALAGPAGVFAGAHEATPHQTSWKTDLT